MERDNTGIKHNNNNTIPDKWEEKKGLQLYTCYM